MIDITELRVVKPNEVEPGTLLLAGAHYSEPPTFVFSVGEELFWFELAGSKPFNGRPMAINLNPFIVGGAPALAVDVDTKISPTRSDIPTGSIALIGDDPFFVIRINHGTTYVGLDGHAIDDRQSYERVVAFPRWKILVPAFGNDEWMTVHDAGKVEDGG